MKTWPMAAVSVFALLALACSSPAAAETLRSDATPRVKRARAHEVPAAGQAQGRAQRRPADGAKGKAESSATSTAASQGGMGVGSQGQSLTVDSHARVPVSSAIAPALMGSNDTCMGSASVGAAGAAVGLSFGRSYTDDNCVMLKNARELWNMGFRGAAVARMCMDEHNRKALEGSGVPCPPAPTKRARADATPADALFGKY